LIRPNRQGKAGGYTTVTEALAKARPELQALYADLDALLLGLGDDVAMAVTKYYFAYRRLRNIACVELRLQTNSLVVFLRVDPDTVEIEEGFLRDVRRVGHLGTGDLEVRISTADDLKRAVPLIEMAYEAG
jgi:predicted transport protein